MNRYPPSPPQLPPPQPPGGYNPFNPFSGYDPNIDYVPWLPGRQGPKFLPYAIVVGAIVICSCCSFLVGVVFGIELPGFLQPSSPPAQVQPEEEPTPNSFQWRLVSRQGDTALLGSSETVTSATALPVHPETHASHLRPA